MSEQETFETRRGISRHLTEEGACLSASNAIRVGTVSRSKLSPTTANRSGFRVSMIWAHKPFRRGGL